MTQSIPELLRPALRQLSGKTGQLKEDGEGLSDEMFDFSDYGCWADEDFSSMLKRAV